MRDAAVLRFAHVPRRRLPVEPCAGALIVVVSAASGGYFPTVWSSAALIALWALAATLLLSKPSIDLSFVAWMSAFGVLLAVTWLSAAWSVAPGATLEDSGRTLLYLSVVALIALLPRRYGRPTTLLGSVCVAVTLVAIYAVATRVFPERLGSFDPVAGYRLAAPFGYWNGLGIFSALGAVLCVGFAARSSAPLARAISSAPLPLLAVALYFTFSRGAWLGLAVGLIVAVIVDPRRLGFVVWVVGLAPAAAVAVYAASQQDALTRQDAALASATGEGHRLAALLLVLCAASGLSAGALSFVGRRWRPSSRARLAFIGFLAASLIALGAAVIAKHGSPWAIADRAWTTFSAPPPEVNGNLNERLFSFSGTYRAETWATAWTSYLDHPWMGSGGGTYEREWLENRDVGLKVRDAHSLYLETLSELGPLGLTLLLLALGVPVYAAFKARGHPLVPAAFGAYVAYLVHAGVDWDWEMPAVTLTALFIGASIVVAARKPEDEEKTMSPRLRYGLLAGTLALAAVAFVGLVGNIALAQSADAARAGDWDKSESKARRAETWAPWSPEPWQRIGEAQLGRGELVNARASFRKAIAKEERDWSLWLDLARASEGRAQLAALGQATQLNPLSPEIAQLRKELGELGTIEVGG